MVRGSVMAAPERSIKLTIFNRALAFCLLLLLACSLQPKLMALAESLGVAVCTLASAVAVGRAWQQSALAKRGKPTPGDKS